MPEALSFRIGALLPKAGQIASQVAVAVLATGLASNLFGSRAPSAPEPVQTGKITARIENAFTPATTLALYPQDMMALSSIERFKPAAFQPASPEPAAPVAAAPARPRQPDVANVLPPPRPPQATLVAAIVAPTPPPPAATEPEAHRLRIAGVSVPLPAVDFSRYVPNKDDVLGTFSRAKSAVDWLTHVSSR